jgi:hypothetical protein
VIIALRDKSLRSQGRQHKTSTPTPTHPQQPYHHPQPARVSHSQTDSAPPSTNPHAHAHTHTRARSPFYKLEVEHDTGQDDLDEEKHGNVDPRPEQNADGEPERRPVSSSAGKIRACNPRKRKKNRKRSKRESRARSLSPPSPPAINDKKGTPTKTLHATSNK